MATIAFELRTALTPQIVAGPVRRAEQYSRGIDSLVSKVRFPDDVYSFLVDNAVWEGFVLPSEIVDRLPATTRFRAFDSNVNGHVNKGAGDIDSWRYMSAEYSPFDFAFHYEPRMLLRDASFIHDFLRRPRNLFAFAPTPRQVLTGYFGMKTGDLMRFAAETNLERMVKRLRSIEDLMFDFVEGRAEIQTSSGYCWRYHESMDLPESC